MTELDVIERLIEYARNAGDETAAVYMEVFRELWIREKSRIVVTLEPGHGRKRGDKYLITDGDPATDHHIGGQKLCRPQPQYGNPVTTIGGKQYTLHEMYRSLSVSEVVKVERYDPDGKLIETLVRDMEPA